MSAVSWKSGGRDTLSRASILTTKAVEKTSSKIPSVGRLSSGLPKLSLRTGIPKPGAVVGEVKCDSEHQAWKGWLGKRVCISGIKLGTLLYYGKTKFSDGIFCGVSLDEPEGKHDGSVAGVRYFNCPPNHGVLAPPSKVEKIEADCPSLKNESPNQPKFTKRSLLSPSTVNPIYKTNEFTQCQTNGTNDNNAQCTVSSSSLNSTYIRFEKNFAAKEDIDVRKGLANGNAREVPFVQDSPLDYGPPPLNVSFTLGQPPQINRNVKESVINRTFEKQTSSYDDPNLLVTNGSERNGIEDTRNTTFSIDHSPVEIQNGTYCLDKEINNELYDIAEDDVDESSLGILTASQMVDFSTDMVLCDMNIPKTQSCDDINELPEDEVVENVTVEYLHLEKKNFPLRSFTFDLNNSLNESPLTPPVSELPSDFHTSTPVLSGLKENVISNFHACSSQEHVAFQAIRKTLDLNLDMKNSPRSSLPLPILEEVSLLENQRLSCSFEDVTVQTSETSSLTEAVFEATTEEIIEIVPNATAHDGQAIVQSSHSRTSTCIQHEQTFTVNKEFYSLHKESEHLVENKTAKWTNIVEELDHLNETLKAKLASGELQDLDPTKLGRVSIESVMEEIQRKEMYKNRPASTYTVGSTDTGYAGDGECDGHSETAGSPCEEVKPLSICSQETDTDRMMKSGHMSDSDFFTDQGASSEMELDGEMKQSISSLLSDGRPGDIGLLLADEIQIGDAVAENGTGDLLEEEKNSSSAEGDQTIVEENSQISKADVTIVIPESQKSEENVEPNSASVSNDESVRKESSLCSHVDDSKESAQINKEQTGKTSKLKKDSNCKEDKTKIEGKKHVKSFVSKTKCAVVEVAPKPPISRPSLLLTSHVQEPPPKKIRSPRKGSKWDAVTSKIAAGLAEEKTKTKDRREIRSRVNTNLTGARQVVTRRSDGTDVTSVTYSSRTATIATESIIHADISKGSVTDPAGENSIEIPRNRASDHPLSNAASPTTPSESSATSSSSFVSNKLPSKIAVPNRTFMVSQPLKPTPASTIDSKKSRPVKSTSSVRPILQKELGGKPAPARKALTIKPEVVQPTVKFAKPNACPPGTTKLLPGASKHSDASQSKPTKTPSRTPALSSRAAQSKIEELSVEVQRLGALCEQRTKELNMVKMQLKHTYCGFDAFAIMVNYLVGELDAFSHPQLLADMQKMREQLACSQKLLVQFENELDYLKKQHSAEVQELALELSRANGEVNSLNSQVVEAESSHKNELEEMERFRVQEMEQINIEHLSHLENLLQEHKEHSDGLETVHLKTLEETKRLHEVAVSELLHQLEELKQKSDSLELQSRQIEEALQRDTDSKIQWIYNKNAKLAAEVDSLKSVMEMKQAEIHSLRKDNLELKKELEELPLAQKQIENLRARNEDLQAMIREKSKSARKLCQEKRQMKDVCERVHKDNRRISMENEELQWKLQQTLDGSWSICSTSPEHERHRRDNTTTIVSPNLSPWNETEEERLLNKSPINYYTLPVVPRSPQSASSSPGKSPSRPPSKTRQRHRSLGQLVTTTEIPCPLVMSESMKEPELYFKACLQYEDDEALEKLFPSSSKETTDSNEQNGGNLFEPNVTHSDSSMSSSMGEEGSSLSSGEADRQPNEQINDKTFDLCSPRSFAGEAMVQDENPSPASSTSPVAVNSVFNRSTITKRTPESEKLPTLPNHVETPSVEVSNHGMPPTDSTTIDDSSYGDDLGLESE